MSKVLVIFGSKSDDKVYSEITKILNDNKVDFDLHVRSAHRTPEEVDKIVNDDYSLVIAGAGLSAALPGVVASKTIRPVIGVPCKGNYEGLDALLSIAQMPPGIPVACVAIGSWGARNAAYLAAQILGIKHEDIRQAYEAYRESLRNPDS